MPWALGGEGPGRNVIRGTADSADTSGSRKYGWQGAANRYPSHFKFSPATRQTSGPPVLTVFMNYASVDAQKVIGHYGDHDDQDDHDHHT